MRKPVPEPKSLAELRELANKLYPGVTWVAKPKHSNASIFRVEAKRSSGMNRIATYELAYHAFRGTDRYELDIYGYGRRSSRLLTAHANDPRDLRAVVKTDALDRIQRGNELLCVLGYLVTKKEY